MRNKILLFSFSLLSVTAFGQEKENDTIVNNLSEVVVTGQFEPQSIKKSVFNVRVISQKDIQQLAANNLADVLNQYLNITIRPSGNDGRSTVSMFGLDGQYFKILVDNIPLVSDSGIGNNIDLTQINLDDIEQIEIIEGSMGVTHGANAVSGILNIITKKSFKNKWEIATTVQEETVGSEYSWFEKGRHIQGLKIGHKITDNWFVSVGANRNDLTGYLGDKSGKDHAINDLTRGFTWLPKEQFVTNAMLNYRRNDFRFFYKFDYLDEQVDFYNRSVRTSNPPFEKKYADDERYLTTRFFHHMNATGKLFSSLNYNVSLSHQKQSRDLEKFAYNITEKKEEGNVKQTDQSSEVLYSTGTFSNFIPNKKYDFQLGYEAVNNIGFAIVDAPDSKKVGVRKRLENYDFFLSSEFLITDKFSIRPGARYSLQSLFDDQYAVSLGFRQIFDKGLEVRASLGKSFRTPNFEELYSKNIFPSHYYVGNENLIPERSTSYEVSVKKATSINDDLQMINDFAVSYTDIKDRIGLAVIEFLPQLKSQFINVDQYQMVNFANTNRFQYKQLSFNAGVSLVGISQVIDNGEAISDDKFLYTVQMNSSVSYNVPKWKSVFSVTYKYNGRQQDFVGSTDAEGNPVYKLATVEEFGWMDASVRKTFFKNNFDVTFGVRNLFDITNVRQTSPNAGAAHPTSGNLMLAYGRSYFLKLTYNLNF